MNLTPEEQRTQLMAIQSSIARVDTYRALLIEDDNNDAALGSMKLISYGIRTDTVTTITEAERRLYYARYSIVFMDWKLIGTGGLEALKLIKEKALTAPVVVLTGSVTEEDVSVALANGAATVMLKPLTDEGIKLIFGFPSTL